MDIILDVIQVNESTLLLIHGDLPLSGSQKIKKKKKKMNKILLVLLLRHHLLATEKLLRG